jgi:hypothetical protein
MYTMIEADIKNGRITGPESRKLPAAAHVMITLLNKQNIKRPEFGTRTSAPVKACPESFAPLSGGELAEWGLA